eukprot:contig_25041_g6175
MLHAGRSGFLHARATQALLIAVIVTTLAPPLFSSRPGTLPPVPLTFPPTPSLVLLAVTHGLTFTTPASLVAGCLFLYGTRHVERLASTGVHARRLTAAIALFAAYTLVAGAAGVAVLSGPWGVMGVLGLDAAIEVPPLSGGATPGVGVGDTGVMVGLAALALLSGELIKATWSSTLAPVALFHIIGFWFGFGVARLLFRMRRPVATAIAFESGFKSPALSFVLAVRHFKDVEVQTASAVSILVLVPLAMGAAVAFHLCVRPEEPEGADGTGSSAADGAKADEENGLPDVPPLELPKVKAPPMDVDTEVNGLAPREVPATSNTAAVTSDKVVNGC